jgi:hypothetical protein
MKTTLHMVFVVTQGLWFGGIVAVFVFVSYLFSHDRAIAVKAAPMIFNVFSIYQLVLGSIAIVAAIAWRMACPSRLITSLMLLSIGSGIFAAVIAFAIVPEMEQIRVAGQSGGDRFKQLHGRSMALFLAETLCLFIATIILPAAIRAASRTVSITDPARSSPADAGHPVAAK